MLWQIIREWPLSPGHHNSWLAAPQVAFKIFVLDPMLDKDREHWSTLGNPCIDLKAEAAKKAEWDREGAAPKKGRRIHEGARFAR